MTLRVVSGASHPLLRHVVRSRYGYAERAPGPVRREELPHGGVTLIVNLGPDLRVNGRAFGSFVAGLHDRPAVTEHAGEQAGLQLYLAPPAARMLLGLPLGELTDATVALEEVLGPGARLLPERLLAQPTWQRRFALMDALIARRLGAARAPAPELVHTWARLVQTGGSARVEALAGEVGWSRRHLAERFRAELGLTPKAYARVVRFERVVAALREAGERRLAEVAADAGYADQPHLTREVRALAGMTPAALRAREFPDVQDAAAQAA